jgi:hypothetical protein
MRFAAKSDVGEEILGGIVPKGKAERREIVSRYFGLFSKPRRTSRKLEAALSCSYRAIHPICRPITDTPSSVLRRFQDASDAAISVLASPATEVESRLARQRLLERGTTLEALLRTSPLLKRDAPFVLRGMGRQQRVLPALNETRLLRPS